MLVLYDTRSGDIRRMARALADGAESVQGVLKRVAEGSGELADADGIILGSPAHHTQLSQAMKRLLSGVSKITLKGRVGAALGSCGWSGEASAIMVRA